MANIVIMLGLAYFGIGLVFGTFFVFKGVNTVDSAARGGPLVFRLLILPGAAGLWPVMLKKWVSAKAGHTQ